MRRSKLIIVGAAIALLMAGCSKGDPEISAASSFEPSVATSEPEETPINHSVIATTTVKAAPYLCTDATLAYPKTDEASTNMVGDSANNASSVGLDEDLFTVIANQGSSSNLPGLNKSGTIYLYGSPSNGNGASFDVTIASCHSIRSITLSLSTNGSYVAVKISGTPIAPEDDGSYFIDGPSFTLQNIQEEEGSPKTAYVKSVTISYEGAAKDVADDSDTQLALSYTYLKEESGVVDALDRATTGATSSTYVDWTNDGFSSGIVYAGKSGGAGGCITLNNTNPSGIVVTENEHNYEARRIVVRWNASTTAGRVVDVYAKNEAYSDGGDLYGGSKGTKICSFTFDSESKEKGITEMAFEITSDVYKYIGLRSNSGSLSLDSIDIEWDTYTYSDVAIRFGTLVRKTLWDRLNTESSIQGYGVFLSTPDHLDGVSIESRYKTALVDHTIDEAVSAIVNENLKNFYTSVASKEHPDLATDLQKGNLTGDYYIWNLYKSVSLSNLKKSYAAVAYIRIADEIIFLTQVSTSVKDLAQDLITAGAKPYDGTLNNLANF